MEYIKKAIEYAKLYHADQKRLSGEPYYTHPVEVAHLIIKYSDSGYRLTTEIIVAAILHDIVEDTDFSLEMVKLEFSNEVAEIVSGLTRVKPDKKLTIPESIEAVFNKQYSFLKKEKANKKTALALFLLDCMWPLCFYFVYVHCGNILKNQFHYSPEQVIYQNFIVSIAQVLNCLAFVILSYRVYPLLILKVKLVISFLLFITCPYFLTHMKSPESLLLIQSAIIFFACDSSPATSIFYRYFPIFKRFTYIGFLYALSRALTYIITSFGFVYLVGYFGNYGTLFIMMPICIGYFYGLRYFEQLERASQ